jgi:hypothetical protein
MKGIIITEEQAKQMYDSGVESLKSIAEINFPELSLIQLRQWRDKANGEHLESWCDWSDKNQTKYSICAYENSWKKHESILFREILVFKTKEIREQFIKDHKSLINKTFNL